MSPKVACVMCTWNERQTAPIAIESTKDFVDHYIIVDKGSEDGTVKLIEEVVERYGLDADIYVKPELFLYEARLFAMKKAEEEWILIQDGDEVFHTNGPNSIFHLKKYMKRLKNIIFCAPMTVLEYDFLHTKFPVYQAPHRFLFYNNGYFIEKKKKGIDIPEMFGVELHLKKVYKFNCRIKSPKRMFLRQFWNEWYHETKAYQKYSNLEDYVKAKLGTKDLTPYINKWIKEYHLKLIVYKENIFGYRPAVIKKYIRKGMVKGYV